MHVQNYPMPPRELKKGIDRVGLSKSHDNLTGKFSGYVDLSQQFNEPSKCRHLYYSFDLFYQWP